MNQTMETTLPAPGAPEAPKAPAVPGSLAQLLPGGICLAGAANDEAAMLDVFGLGVEVLISSENSGGAFASYRVTTQPGQRVGAHIHQYDDECFYVLSGTIEVLCGSETRILEPGGQVFLPRGVAHGFANVGTTVGQLLGFATPGGHERFFVDMHQLALQGFTPKKAAAVCERHGILLQGPSG